MPTQRPILDEDGENRAVRSFLMLYGYGNPTAKDMAQHLRSSGYDIVPDWAAYSPSRLTKGEAQIWLRMLFDAEKAELPKPIPDCGEAGHAEGGCGNASCMPTQDTRVAELVRSILLLARQGMLSFEGKVQRAEPVDPVFAIVALRMSYAWKDTIPGWKAYRDYVVVNWPADADRRELCGL